MPILFRVFHFPARYRAGRRGTAALLLAGALFSAGCSGYQLELQPTGTPGPLGVRQIPGQTATTDPVALIAQVARAALGTVTPAGSAATAAPAEVASSTTNTAAAANPAAAAPAAAAAAPATGGSGVAPAAPVAARAASAGSSSPAQPAAPPVVSGAPAATPVSAPPSGTVAPTRAPAAALQAGLLSGSGIPLPSYTPTTTAVAPMRATATPSAPRRAVETTPAPTAAATVAPMAASTPKPSTGPVQVFLPQGANDFLYVGPTQAVDKALAGLAGGYEIVYFAGTSGQVAYRPGLDAAPVLPNNTLVRIAMKKPMSFVMYP